jgi:signal transduction histidine kinase
MIKGLEFPSAPDSMVSADRIDLAAPSPVDLDLSRPDIGEDASRLLLAGAVSHELRSTLALISGYSQSLLRLSLDEETRRKYLERILAATEALTEFADQILDLSLLGPGGPALRRRPVAFKWLVDQLMREIAWESDTATVRYESSGHIPMVDVDPSWIGHVLHNLVANAFKHGSGATGITTIRARHVGGFVVVSVCDDGAGFQPDERDLVFDPLYRGHRARAEGVEGAGLGLYMCRELVEAHGGRIWLDDTTGGGSVSFSVPCYRARPAVNGQIVHGLKTVLAAGG